MDGQPRALIMGCGGIGGVVADCLARANVDLLVVTRNPEIAAAIAREGVRIREHGRLRSSPVTAAATLPESPARFDFAFLATQPPQVVAAAAAAAPFLTERGVIVCFQNGLCEEHVARVAGSERTIGAIVAWGATMHEPGVYERTSEGGFVLGRSDGAADDRFDTLRALLGAIGPVDVTHNLIGARWSKLAINCAISSLGTIGGQRLGELLRHRFVRRLALEIMTEAVAVARRAGVLLEKVSGTIDLDWVSLTPEDTVGPGSPSLLAKHALLLAVGARFRRLRSSMLAAIERGREPAVDFLNGEVIRRADALGLAVPINRRVQDTIYAIWRREERPGLRLLRRLYDESRHDAYAATVGAAPA
jgi:2-dehydropantoate 2-reductase